MNTRNDTELHNAKVGDRIYSMVHDQFLTVNHIVRAMSGKWYIEFEGKHGALRTVVTITIKVYRLTSGISHR